MLHLHHIDSRGSWDVQDQERVQNLQKNQQLQTKNIIVFHFQTKLSAESLFFF